MLKDLEPPHIEWLELRGISAKLIDKFDLRTATALFPPEDDTDPNAPWVKRKCISVPYRRGAKVFNHKYRRTPVKQHVMDKGAELGFWNEEAVDRAAGGTLVISEGEWDGMIADDMGWEAVSVPNGAPKEASDDPANAKRYEYLWLLKDKLLKVERFILATDGDEAGIALRHDLIALLGPVRCSFVEYPEGTKDLTDVRLKYGPEEVAACLNNAKPVPVAGIHKLSDFPEAPDLPMFDLQIPGLEGAFGLIPATFSIITGYAGHGKSSLVMKMIANLIASGKRVTIGSFETLPRPILERKLQAAMVEAAEHDPSIWRSERGRTAHRILHERLTVIANTPDEDHELDMDALLDLMETAVQRHESDLVVLDPFNEIEHRRKKDETETEYVGRFIRTVKRFCHRTGCPVWLVAHPRTPRSDGIPKMPSLYDLSGSANFANKADYGIVAHRPDIERNEIDVAVTKVRMGLPGRCGRVTLRLDAGMSRYTLVEGMDDGQVP